MHDCSKPCTPCPEQHAELFSWQDVVEFALVSANPRYVIVSHNLAGSSLEPELNLPTLNGRDGHGQKQGTVA